MSERMCKVYEEKKLAELLKKRKVAAGLTAVVLAVAVGSVAVVQQKSDTGTSVLYGS